jgi:hypothetical protein
MTPSDNYSAYFQAQLQVIPQKIVQPVKEKSKVVIRYKRNWTKEQNIDLTSSSYSRRHEDWPLLMARLADL